MVVKLIVKALVPSDVSLPFISHTLSLSISFWLLSFWKKPRWFGLRLWFYPRSLGASCLSLIELQATAPSLVVCHQQYVSSPSLDTIALSDDLVRCTACNCFRNPGDFQTFKSGKLKKTCFRQQKKRDLNASLDKWDAFLAELHKWNHPVCQSQISNALLWPNKSRDKQIN